MPDIPAAQVQVDFGAKTRTKRQDPERGPSSWGLNYAVVVSVQDAERTAVLRTLGGTSRQREPIKVTFPYSGKRAFLGVMPSVRDVAVIGWMAQESSGGSQQPVILAWLPPQAWTGQSWNPLSEVSPEEFDLESQENQDTWQGVYDITRHRALQLDSGNAGMSSSQGSDLVLTESALLRNRRGNEFYLRDQDQTVVTRAVSSHTALAGVRSQQGLVQRNARILPRQIVSDGSDWASGLQVDPQGRTVTPEGGDQASSIACDASGFPAGYLQPGLPMRKLPGDTNNLSGLRLPDPYQILQQGGFIDAHGFVQSPQYGTEIYGGKPMWRVTAGPGRVLTESLTEIQHDHDGTLPVDDQTDGFDLERVPVDRRYLTISRGTVVGNDPRNEPQYGVPLVPQVFRDHQADPRWVSGIERPLGKQGAWALRLQPPEAVGNPDESWTSLTKDGRLQVVAGNAAGQDPALEMLLRNHAEVEVQGTLTLRTRQTALKGNVAHQGSLKSSGKLVQLEGSTQASLRSHTALYLQAPLTKLDSQEARLGAYTSFNIESGDQISLSSQRYRNVVSGSAQYLYGGPEGGQPSGGAIRHTTIVGQGVGSSHVADYLAVPVGSRQEKFDAGNSTTQTQLGTITHQATEGSVKATAGQNSHTLDSTAGLDQQIPTGNVKLVTGGQYSATAQSSWSASTSGTASLTGTLGVTLRAYGKTGTIVSGADLDPISGLPLTALGMGSPGHRIAT